MSKTIKVTQLKNVVGRIVENVMSEMARIPSKFELTDDYEVKLGSAPDQVKNGSRYKRVIEYLKAHGGATTKEIAVEEFKTQEQAAVNPIIQMLTGLGIVKSAGLVSEPIGKVKGEPGIKGRPKLTNDEIKQLGIAVIRKFSKGQSDYTPEEIKFIEDLASSIGSAEENI